jgi:hypothetical protein
MADENKTADFMQGVKMMLGMDDDRVKDLIDHLDADALTELTDAVANQDKQRVQQIVAKAETDEEVNPLFRGDNLDDKLRKKKHRRRVASNYEFKHGEDVQVLLRDPETGKPHYEDGTVYLPNGPDNTVGVKIQGKSKMVDHKRVRRLEESVLGMVDVPAIARMQQLAGLQPAGTSEIAGSPPSNATTENDSCTAAQQALQALDVVAGMLPNIRLADLKVIRQRLLDLQNEMNQTG